MTSDLCAADVKEAMADHLATLAGYARRVVSEGEALTPDEEADKAVRMRVFLGIGTSFKCTRKELVTLLYRGIFESKRGCACFTCKSRRANGLPAS